MDALLDLLEPLGRAGGEDDVAALERQRLGGRRADAAAGAGHQGEPPVEESGH
jgi:hypothetical protein